ncbi:xylulokinase [Sphaerisporangium aureirubrum]|uniref:FGGY-family carbohydrate kinase n=1 Tax=Sphaerisporangium aureirubrum TaxID=1544736 RepID=A0ABW1NJR7_9ACTN
MWLGLDVGTSSVKAVLLDDGGAVAGRGSGPVRTVRAGPDHAEQAPEDYVRAAAAATADACRAVPGVRLRGIGLSGQTPTLVVVDDEGEPVRPALGWQDTRARRQARELERELGDPYPLIGTSLPWSASACPAKLRWLAEHEPHTVRRARWLLQPKDYLGLVLTGSPLSDPWSSKGLCHVLTSAPAAAVVEAAGWPVSAVPPLAPGWTARGTLTAAGAKALGLRAAPVPVSVGCSDAMSGMLALGALTAPTSFVLTGTSSMSGTSVRAGPEQAHPLYVIPPACSPMTVVYGPTQSSGASVEWAGRMLGRTPDEIVDLAATARAGPRPAFVPYLSGERAPIWRDDVRAVLAGLGADDGPAEFAAAVLAGVSLADRHVLETAAGLIGAGEGLGGVVRLGGHAGRDRRWWEIRGRTLGVDLEAVDDADPPSRGAAMLAMAASGAALTTAVERLAAPVHRVAATAESRREAAHAYAVYLRWAAKVLDLMAETGASQATLP